MFIEFSQTLRIHAEFSTEGFVMDWWHYRLHNDGQVSSEMKLLRVFCFVARVTSFYAFLESLLI